MKRSGHNKTVDWYLLGVLIYEMVTGLPPFYSSNRDKLFENIVKGQLLIPNYISENCKDIIKNVKYNKILNLLVIV